MAAAAVAPPGPTLLSSTDAPTQDEIATAVSVLRRLHKNSELLTTNQDLQFALSSCSSTLKRFNREKHNKKRVRQHDKDLINETEIVKSKRVKHSEVLPEAVQLALPAAPIAVITDGTAPPPLPLEPTEPENTTHAPGDVIGEFHREKQCYTCKGFYSQVHWFYSKLCPPCATLNYEKRIQTADLSGDYIALVTGARVKIGYEITLKLLRAGCRVIATTRFPKDAMRRFAQQKDFSLWGHKLDVYGIDFRMLRAVERFCDFVKLKYDHLDIIINNAALTVRRAPGFYAHLLEYENTPVSSLPAPMQGGLLGHELLNSELATLAPAVLGAPTKLVIEHLASLTGDEITPDITTINVSDLARQSVSVALSQVALLDSDGPQQNEITFPAGHLDGDAQQVDMSAKNSWKLQLDEVSTVELVEVTTVNALAPFVINARLKPLLERSPHDKRFIINVSAMEGKFSWENKPTTHPHTNCAKASLNMQTRTSAAQYVKASIFMNAVDTGWVSDMKPTVDLRRIHAELGINSRIPLDEIDGAARVLDPVFVALNEGKLHSGLFFKDYAPVDW